MYIASRMFPRRLLEAEVSSKTAEQSNALKAKEVAR